MTKLLNTAAAPPTGDGANRRIWAVIFIAAAAFCGCQRAERGGAVSGEMTAGQIQSMRGVLAPVYAPLAEQIVKDYNLANKLGIGIDVGAGHGALIIELCKRTKMDWINADINAEGFPVFLEEARKNGFAERVRAVQADAQALPFPTNYADIIVSRGSFHFWKNKVAAFDEIYRVLKPGGVAYIGRGFPRDLPIETAKAIRAKQTGMDYDAQNTAQELEVIMLRLGIGKYRIERPKADNKEGVNYGVWVEFRK